MITRQEQIGNSIYWAKISPEPISEYQAQTMQMFKGYHPAGYGFDSFKVKQQADGSYLAEWRCGASCDQINVCITSWVLDWDSTNLVRCFTRSSGVDRTKYVFFDVRSLE